MNSSKKLLITIGLFFLILSCSIRQKSEQEVMSEIYSDIIFTACKDQEVVISSLTSSRSFDESDWQWISENFPKLKRETWENFVQVNSQQIPFPNDLELGCKYTLRDVKQNPPDFSREDPVWISSFSQIGFDSSKSQALVSQFSSFFSFAWPGSEGMYFAEIVDGHWKVTNALQMSIFN